MLETFLINARNVSINVRNVSNKFKGRDSTERETVAALTLIALTFSALI